MCALDNPFWTYSLTTYARDGAAAACLDLQDQYDVDVNLLLLCCWLGTEGVALDSETVRRAIQLADEWAGPVIAPLRAVRRHLKPLAVDSEIAAFREQVAALELSAEQIQQARLHAAFEGLSGSGDDPVRAAVGNLRLYLSLAAPGAGDGIQDSLLKLVRAAFPGAAEADIVSALAVPASDQTR
ncbi:MAG: TIGR02444 family protein [Nisaea sp.]|uniref:TIGR02444 family protein n=1 Tax=Nisaea sp. TaxID=2024842 RepID=UPI001B259BFE|nr:TIGR02444 family protein [Nisaea sp.]MBO6560307.1 TIGR02444 family protein [Nisaea sp.]